jgi:hypothetical protein
MYQTIYQEKFGVNERRYKNNLSISFNTMWGMNPRWFARKFVVITRRASARKQLVSNSRPRKSHIWGKKRSA